MLKPTRSSPRLLPLTLQLQLRSSTSMLYLPRRSGLYRQHPFHALSQISVGESRDLKQSPTGTAFIRSNIQAAVVFPLQIITGNHRLYLPTSPSILLRMKRRRSISLLSTPQSATPSSPPTPQTLLQRKQSITSKTISSPSKRSKRSLTQTLKAICSPNTSQIHKWLPLNLGKSELSLPLTFPTGQTFRWKQTGPLQYTGVVKSHLVSLKHLDDGDVAYCFHNASDSEANAKLALLDFLNVGICLTDLWERFSASDERFAQLAIHLKGARVLRQDPLECLMQFLCSSNNNIGRITRMVDYISSLGKLLGTVEGFEFHEFPSLERLAMVSEEELREAGFGYRAKYIIGTVKALQDKPGGGVGWLSSLRELDLEEVISALSTFPGVGPKVAACMALFSLDQHHAVPVDTHVWQIATRYLTPELAGAHLTPKLCTRVAEAFVLRYGKYAGWAQTLLFIAELPSQKTLLQCQVLDCQREEK